MVSCGSHGAVLFEIANAADAADVHIDQHFLWRKELLQIAEPKTQAANPLVPVFVPRPGRSPADAL